MAHLIGNIKQKFFDSNGDPLAGGKLYSYAAGTSTPLATYTDAGAGTENANPTILDANGEAQIWVGSSSYKFVLKDSSDVTIWTVDNVAHVASSGITLSMLAAGILTADVAGRAKMADSYVNTAKIATSALSADTDGQAKMADGFLTANVAGRLKMADGFVNASKIEADAVTTVKVLDGNVTFAKLDTDFIASATAATPVEADSILIGDASDSNLVKRATLAEVNALFGYGSKRVMQYLKNSGAATATNLGFSAAPTLTATTSSVENARGTWLRHTSAASDGAATGVVSTVFTTVKPAWLPEMSVYVEPENVGGGTPAARYIVGFFSASPDALGELASTDTAPAVAIAAFVCEAPGSGGANFYKWNWVAYTSNGTGGAGNCTRTYTENVAASRLRIVFVTSTEVQFFLDDVLVATHTTDLPDSEQSLGFGCRAIASAANAVYIQWSRIEVKHR